jgi:hypothetical protein
MLPERAKTKNEYCMMSKIVYLSGEPIVHGYSFAGGGKLPPCPSQGLMFKHPFRYDDTGVEKDQK